jgi:hypothetical protein
MYLSESECPKVLLPNSMNGLIRDVCRNIHFVYHYLVVEHEIELLYFLCLIVQRGLLHTSSSR